MIAFNVFLCRPFTHLCNIPDLVTTLYEISATYDVSPILHYMLPHLVHSVIYGKRGMLIYFIFQRITELQELGLFLLKAQLCQKPDPSKVSSGETPYGVVVGLDNQDLTRLGSYPPFCHGSLLCDFGPVTHSQSHSVVRTKLRKRQYPTISTVKEYQHKDRGKQQFGDSVLFPPQQVLCWALLQIMITVLQYIRNFLSLNEFIISDNHYCIFIKSACFQKRKENLTYWKIIPLQSI